MGAYQEGPGSGRRYQGRRRGTPGQVGAGRRYRLPLLIAAFSGLTLLAGGAFLADLLSGEGPAGDPASASATPTPTTPAPTLAPTPTPTPTPTEPPPVLALPGDYPTDGPGEFRYAPGEGEVLGESGPLLRFRVAVEEGIGEDPTEVATFVTETLGAEQGWTAGGDLRLQQVPEGAGHDFTVYLATSGTTARMCATGGLDVLGSGLPDGGVSCRVPGQAVINYTRWRESVPHYVDREVPLVTYRQMVVNHEVGHEFGYGHEDCPGAGQPAPVMMQQTIRLDGCEAYPWPYLNGARHTGPPVP